MDKLKPMAQESNSVSDIEARFTDYCKNGLSMHESSMTEAMKLFNESKHLLQTNKPTGTPEDAERYWFAFVLYSMRRLSESNLEMGEQGITLCQVLRVAKLNLVDFFKEIPQFIVKAGPILCNLYGPYWEKKLKVKELQANFVDMSLLSRHYRRAFHELLSVEDTNIDKQSAASDVSDYFRFGWLLFLALRVHAFSQIKDFVTCLNGLVSIMAILIIHVPICYRKFTTDDSSRFIKNGDKRVDVIASLCKMFETSEDELRKTMDKTSKVIESILKMKPCLASECKIENLNISTDALIYYDGLLEEMALSTNLSILEKDYEDAIFNKIELDERVFLDEDDSLLRSSSLFGGAINISGTKRKQTEIVSSSSSSSSSCGSTKQVNRSNGNESMEKRNCVPDIHVRGQTSSLVPSQSVSDVFRRPDKEFVELRNKIADELKRLYDKNMITDFHQLINAGRAWHSELVDTGGIMIGNLFLCTDDEKKVAITMKLLSKAQT